MGADPGSGFSFLLGRQGWTWVGMPGLDSLGYPDFMDSVRVQYPAGGDIRTASEDRASGSPWVNWSWAFWDTYLQAAKTFAPYLAFGNNTCHPWIGYRIWVNAGLTPQDPNDRVTLIWP
jgi:hypothetical protein